MRQMITLLVGSLLAMSAMAAGTGVTVSNAWSRATAPGQSSGGVWFSISSKEDAKLIAASCPLAGTTELHTMSHEQGMMKMHAVESIALPAGKTVDLAPGSYHVMLADLKQPLKAGDSVPLKLTVEFADKHKEIIRIKAKVRPLTARNDMQDKDMHGMSGMGGM
jgi:periplasmic copper chaperone A